MTRPEAPQPTAAAEASWVRTHLVPLLVDHDRLAAMWLRASATGDRDADSVLARRVLGIVSERRAAAARGQEGRT